MLILIVGFVTGCALAGSRSSMGRVMRGITRIIICRILLRGCACICRIAFARFRKISFTSTYAFIIKLILILSN